MAYTKPIHTAQIHNCKYIHALVGTQSMRANKIQRKYAKFNIFIQSKKTRHKYKNIHSSHKHGCEINESPHTHKHTYTPTHT